ncbi:hypothetical protein ES332_D05G331300v1 [Gossypium tomentosum]|uniref:Uncharacterized protein n=1 Tax=Gossypium tomentosum TaxID=34277 RepID=A0A5D2L321_GOSTO|nr:hypothetical protein ES332_D05G331300v1 [Gossypium tomentosum]
MAPTRRIRRERYGQSTWRRTCATYAGLLLGCAAATGKCC